MAKTSLSILPEPPDGEKWVSGMLAMIEKHAPSMSPEKLKSHLICTKMLRLRTEEELVHFARNGYFLTHTPEQAEAERLLIEMERAGR